VNVQSSIRGQVLYFLYKAGVMLHEERIAVPLIQQDPFMDLTQKSKDKHTPLWKYVTKLTGGKGGGTGKFICHHCNTEYTGSYTRVRKHLCGSMY